MNRSKHVASSHRSQGFTLLELAIVFTILGLLVGFVASAQTLVESGRISGQIKQIDELKIAMQSFRVKYGYLPGDFPHAEQFGMHPRINCPGYGNGDRIVQGVNNINGPCSQYNPVQQATSGNGEALFFWQDLGDAGFISPLRNLPDNRNDLATFATDVRHEFFPAAKIGNNNKVFVWSGGYAIYSQYNSDGKTYFAVSYMNPAGGPREPGMTVQQAHSIDMKMDDGMPQSGMTLAIYTNGPSTGSYTPAWAAGAGLVGASGTTCCQAAANYNGPVTTATPYAITNCYDNNNVAGPQVYSTAQNAAEKNCALSFRLD